MVVRTLEAVLAVWVVVVVSPFVVHAVAALQCSVEDRQCLVHPEAAPAEVMPLCVAEEVVVSRLLLLVPIVSPSKHLSPTMAGVEVPSVLLPQPQVLRVALRQGNALSPISVSLDSALRLQHRISFGHGEPR